METPVIRHGDGFVIIATLFVLVMMAWGNMHFTDMPVIAVFLALMEAALALFCLRMAVTLLEKRRSNDNPVHPDNRR